MIYVNINVSDFLTFCEAIRGSTIVPSDMKKEAFKKTLELRPKTSQDLLEFFPKKKKKKGLTKITDIVSYKKFPEKEGIKNIWTQVLVTNDHMSFQGPMCETQGAGLHVRKWKI